MNISPVGKFVATECRVEVSRGWEVGGGNAVGLSRGPWVSFGGDETSGIESGDGRVTPWMCYVSWEILCSVYLPQQKKKKPIYHNDYVFAFTGLHLRIIL